MNGRCISRNRRAATVGLAALVALTRQTAEARGEYVGCFRDERVRALPKNMGGSVEVLEDCLTSCGDTGAAYAGLEFEHECWCGQDYDLHGEADGQHRKCDMVLSEDTEVEAGGRWAMSVYNLSYSINDDVDVDQLELNAGSSASLHAGGDTDLGETGLGPVEQGNRAFTVVNNCTKTIRIGATGGRITFGSGTDASDPALCEDWGKSAVYNEGPLGIGCYWDLPPEASGNTDRILAPGKSFRYPLFETESDVRWSGNIWASTGCDEANGGIAGCATGVCFGTDNNVHCPAYVGPGGPTTKAEFTLSDSGTDYYDVSAIDGVNLGMTIAPDDPWFYSAEESERENIKKYWCGTPGAGENNSSDFLSGCSWSYDSTVPTIEGDMSQYVHLVFPKSYESPITCDSDADCLGDLKCGSHPQRWADGSYKGGVEQGSCGQHIAWVSAGGACAGGWTTGEFPDAFPFFCGETVKHGMRANMYGCHGGEYAHSGYTPGATDTACGCPEWDQFGIVAPSISKCNGINPEWVEKAMPWAAHLKKACPTAYTFPYDDQTSTFNCNTKPSDDADEDEDYVNTQSYTITFCPDDSEKAMFPAGLAF